MAKMRVHELAKELNIKSQDILDKLKNTKFDGKSASSNMEDEAQALIRGAFAKETKSAADAKNRKLQRLVQENQRMERNVQRRNPASQPYLMHSTANRAAAAAAITIDVLEMVTDARGMATAVHRDRIQTAAMRRQDRHPVMM